MNDVARIVKIYKAQLNLTNSDIAKQTGIPENTIARICSGKTSAPKLSTLKKLANVFNCSIDDLSGTEDGVEPYYLDKATGAIAINLKENVDLKNLLDVAKDLTSADLQTLIGIVNMLKRK
jgi:transcriptional regulator with XRE-family HTH domain